MSKKGYKMSEEHKRKIGEANKVSKLGIRPSKESIKKRIESRIRNGKASKEKHWNWKGGVTPLRESIRQCFKYRLWRSDVFTRDDFVCQWCFQWGGKLRVDHIKAFRLILDENHITTIDKALNCEELWNINNGRTLCEDCHKKTDTYGIYR